MSGAGFLARPEPTPRAKDHFDEDIVQFGHIMNASRLWAYQPAAFDGIVELLRQTSVEHGITTRQRGILVTACASALGDSYCAISWGTKLARTADAQTASAVLRGDDTGLTAPEHALAAWARKVVRGPSHTTPADIQDLRDNGFTDAQIFAITVFVSIRIAYSTVNDALGAQPDAFFHTLAPAPVRDAVTFGRPLEEATSSSSALLG
ncbi:hypothetical protein GCM10022251_37310 [Phytohabitans flavus]|uniref:carboxymuconolactone decarboxylase family protein n=1 Tax=Phytohabitans flavus TaxID=1076124 RepID=UPI0031E58B26